MIAAARLALSDVFSPPFRRVLLASLALTIALLAALWALVQWLLARFVDLPWGWAETALSVLTGVGLLVGLGFLVAPATALFAGLFLDRVAEIVERTHYPHDPAGEAPPFLHGLALSAKFLGVVLLVNAIALPLVLVVGFGVAIFLAANAYLIGREYFQLAALRFHDEATVRALRARHAARIFGGGLIVAALLAVPVANLFAPLFATSLMVHFHKRIAAGGR
jgi:CysZ protein